MQVMVSQLQTKSNSILCKKNSARIPAISNCLTISFQHVIMSANLFKEESDMDSKEMLLSSKLAHNEKPN